MPVPYEPASRLPDSPTHCPYCGCVLNPALYFCPGCGTPFQSANAVVPRARPVQLTDEELIHRKAPQALTLFWTFAAVIVFVGIACNTLLRGDDASNALLTMIVVSLALVITVSVFAAMHWRSLTVQFRRLGFGRWQAWAGLAALAPVLGLNYLYHGMIRRQFEMTGEGIRELGIGEPTLIVLICVMPAIIEEIAFRGLLQHWLQVAIAPWKAWMAASVMFAMMHMSFISFPYLLLAGMLMGWLKWKTGSLYPSMLVHFLHNFIVLEYFWT